MSLNPIITIITDGLAGAFGADGNIYALFTLLIFGVIVFIQGQKIDGKIAILIPASMMSFHLASNPLLKVLFVLIFSVILFFAVRKITER